ncbi:hypothetical protein I3760_05G132300 [Carya illinoinensis]|nr:hypothetical protein I3760_05G132300 [Carya illinoinensis]
MAGNGRKWQIGKQARGSCSGGRWRPEMGGLGRQGTGDEVVKKWWPELMRVPFEPLFLIPYHMAGTFDISYWIFVFRWSAIATHLLKRTDKEIKNYWNTHLKKRLTKMGIDPMTHKPKTDALGTGSGDSKDAANLRHMALWENARLEAEAKTGKGQVMISSAPAQNINKTLTQSALPPCLDVLKAWQLQGLWSKSTGAGIFPVAGDHDLESSTFTVNAFPIQSTVALTENQVAAALDFAANSSVTCGVGIIKEACQMPEELKERWDNTMSLQEMTYTTESAWLADSFRAMSENTPPSNIVEAGFTDILAYNGDDKNS